MGNLIHAAEGAPQIDGAVHGVVAGEFAAKLSAEIAHQMDIRTGETVDGLPVIADRKEARILMLRLQGAKEPSAPLGDILKLIDQDMPVRALVAAGLDIGGGADNHVLEVNHIAEARFIGVDEGIKDFEE